MLAAMPSDRCGYLIEPGAQPDLRQPTARIMPGSQLLGARAKHSRSLIGLAI